MADAPASSTAPVPAPVEAAAAPADASQLIADGQRLAALKDHAGAAEAFSRAVELITAEHGDLAPESVEPLISYGKALLNTAIAQSGVLGGPSGPAASAPNAPVALSGPVAGPSTPKATHASAAGDDAPRGPNFHFGDGEAGFAAGSDDDGGEDAVNDDPDESADPAAEEPADDDLETAFGVLDQARVILLRMDTPESRLRLALVHSLLGDVATENEEFESAIKEYRAALRLQTELLEPHDRRIAETHMMVALALEFSPSTLTKGATTESTAAAVDTASNLSALEHARAAKTVLELRLAHLAAEPVSPESVAEVRDIGEVMVELDLKIEDLIQAPLLAKQAAEDKAASAASLSGVSLLPAGAPVNNLSGLVKKKPAAPVPAPTPNADGAAVNGKREADESIASDEAKRTKVGVVA